MDKEKNRNEEYYERVNLLLDAMIKAVKDATENESNGNTKEG